MTDDQDLEDLDEVVDDGPTTEPWHNSTPAVLAASAIGLALIGILVAVVMFATGSDEPAPQNFVEPSFSATPGPATSTTETMTSTPKVSTTEINAPSTSPTSSESSRRPSFSATRRPQGGGNATTSKRRGPRINVTRTFLPQPIG